MHWTLCKPYLAVLENTLSLFNHGRDWKTYP